MKTYADIIDLLNFEGPGLQDYVTPDELDQLLDGTLPVAAIADRYMEDLDFTTVVAVSTDPAQTRADLLTWIRWEIETAIEQRKEYAGEDAALARLRAVAAAEARQQKLAFGGKLGSILRARPAATKDAIAKTLGISRPTLNQWLTDQEDRALFDQALYLLGKAQSGEAQDTLFAALGIRDTRQQAATILTEFERGRPAGLTQDQIAVLDLAMERARRLT